MVGVEGLFDNWEDILGMDCNGSLFEYSHSYLRLSIKLELLFMIVCDRRSLTRDG